MARELQEVRGSHSVGAEIRTHLLCESSQLWEQIIQLCSGYLYFFSQVKKELILWSLESTCWKP